MQKNKENKMKNNSQLKLSFLGGVGEVGKNMMVLEYGEDMIIVDCGVAFPSDDMPGIDLVIPDFSYVIKNKNRIKAVIITHGHEDHIGALPYLMQEINAPVYASRLSAALIDNKLKEHKKKFKTNVVKNKSIVKAGCFTIEFVKVTHSISGYMGIAVTTPIGVWFHTGDFKMDFTPIDGEPIDLIRLAEISKKGVLLLTADSTNAERPGFSMSEKKVGATLDGLFAQNKQKRIIIATFASNVHRIQQILDLCEKYGRKTVFTGRSMQNVCETASKIGELRYNRENITDVNSLNKYDDDKICILCTGSQGEPNSALSRMANGEFPKVEITNNDYIIFSASAIPGNEKEIGEVINALYKKGASVIYESLAEVHVSGHAYQEELKTIQSIIRPKFFVPCHGEFRHLRAHANISMDLGKKEREIVIPDLGDTITITPNSIKKSGQVPAGIKLIDGMDISSANGVVQRDRMQLATEGLCVVVLTISSKNYVLTSKPDIVTKGFIYANDNANIIEEAKDMVVNTILNANFKANDWSVIKDSIRKNLGNLFFKALKRKPIIIPIIVSTM